MQSQEPTPLIGPVNINAPRADARVPIKLGRLVRQPLREVFASEAGAFTPWLARDENIALLGETLALSLEVEAQEKAVGAFRADILCRDADTDHWVLIENQLERTDHTHLGQLLTYASGLEAVTIIWVADRFTDEHRSTLDWLNRITDERFRFFGVEVELWRIETSLSAPKFNVVCKPNGWSQSVAQAAHAIESAVLSDTRLMQQEYWTALNEVLDEKRGPVSGHRKGRARASMRFSTGRSRFQLRAAMLRAEGRIRAELHIGGVQAKIYFSMLREQKEAIERELGYPLTWEELPEGQDSRIASYLEGVDPEERGDWPRQHGWLADRLNDLHRVFAGRIRTLDADESFEDAATD